MGDDDDAYEYVSYKSPKTIMAETFYHFCRGGLYGAAFGMVTPFYEVGTKGAILEAKTGIFKPAPVLGSLSSVPTNAIIFGSLLAVQRFACKSVEYLRGKQDPWSKCIYHPSCRPRKYDYIRCCTVPSPLTSTYPPTCMHRSFTDDVFGCFVAYPYYQTCLTKHAVGHNRVVGGMVVLSIAFANIP
jgi:hypothetical protein